MSLDSVNPTPRHSSSDARDASWQEGWAEVFPERADKDVKNNALQESLGALSFHDLRRDLLSEDFSSVDLSEEVGSSTSALHMKQAAEDPQYQGTTREKVGQALLRGLAAVAGGLLYGSSILVGGGLALAADLPLFLVAIHAIPSSLIGGIAGGIMGFFDSDLTVMEGIQKGAILGSVKPLELGLKGALLLGTPFVFLNRMVYNTTGKLGAGLCAFAFTGDNIRSSDHLVNERLMNKLANATASHVAEIQRLFKEKYHEKSDA